MANVFDQFDNGANPFDSFDSVTPEPKGATTQRDFVEGLRNLAPSSKNLAKDLIQPVLHPIDTVEGLVKLTAGLTQKAVLPKDKEGEYEKYVDAVGEHIDYRYGSWDKFKTTLQQDPAGAIADIASVMVGGAGLAKAATKGVTRGIAKSMSRDKPVEMYQDAAKFSTTMDLGEVDKVTEVLLKNKILPTREGTKKLAGMLTDFNGKVNKLIDNAVSSNKRIPRNAVFAEFRKLRKELGGFKAEGRADLAALDNFAREMNLHLNKFGKSVTPRQLQDFKLDMYDKINWDATYQTGTPVVQKIRKAAARSAKNSMNKAIPGLENVNTQYAELLNVLDPLIRSTARLRNSAPVSLKDAANVVAGGSVGGVPGAITAGGVTSFLTGVPRARLAQALYHMQRDTSPLYRPGLTEAGLGAIQTGRLSEILSEYPPEE
ncbi:MAG: hypothetical protein N0C84_05900 [Candidatus Thiodiazotropha taylori]|uniref:Uncharacterized protein n=1 Tax=Candidatus Thiodiazotropha taylori TaxID=2792791 RepID=A0A9E4N473_9GAMM|nr:hypothetical protein [Candidatus Thiodiazotropha taylori]MCW4255987.1 hypothetical protein [Candidatus Thiodiazotropha taylori]